MILKENSGTVREKSGAAAPQAERPGDAVKAAPAASAVTVAASAASEGRASIANGPRLAYVPTRRRSRRNLLL